MKWMATLLVLGLLAALPATASAQDGAKKKHGKKRESLLKKFDKDGDGKLSKEERKTARESMKKDGKGKKKGKGEFRRKKGGDRKFDKSERKGSRKFRDSHRAKRRS